MEPELLRPYGCPVGPLRGLRGQRRLGYPATAYSRGPFRGPPPGRPAPALRRPRPRPKRRTSRSRLHPTPPPTAMTNGYGVRLSVLQYPGLTGTATAVEHGGSGHRPALAHASRLGGRPAASFRQAPSGVRPTPGASFFFPRRRRVRALSAPSLRLNGGSFRTPASFPARPPPHGVQFTRKAPRLSDGHIPRKESPWKAMIPGSARPS